MGEKRIGAESELFERQPSGAISGGRVSGSGLVRTALFLVGGARR
jgi:hypothetical protein